ncbi:MAG: CO dehydrogenase/CO-methylating acetyl-CoA synthase complex subunit beta [Candidatus Helarchaeota archaeon]
MWSDLPFNVGLVYEGERIRGKQTYVELGGPKQPAKFELVQVKDVKDIKDMDVEIIGPDIPDMKEGGNYPIGVLVEVGGKQAEKDLEAVLERRIHEFSNFIEGLMHLNQRYDIWMRISKAAVKKGFNSLKMYGTVLARLYKSEFGKILEKIQVKLYTDPDKIKPIYDNAMGIWEARDARARDLSDDEVDMFYGCTLCSSFAPSHVCTVTPGRIALCGAINWFDARAAAKIDPEGPNFAIPKGECLDELAGEYSGINEITKKKSLGEIERVTLHTILSPYNHTSCGCFEAIAFFVPEVDGVGIVDRNYKGTTVNGLPFSTMANSTGGGKQVEGFVGMAIEYMRSKKFLQADGGWNRIVWMPAGIKNRIIDAIPKDIVDKIATEEVATDLDSLKSFLKEKNHPVVKNWVEEAEEEEEEEAAPMVPAGGMQMPSMVPMMGGIQVASGGANWKIILKGAKIYADEIHIKRIQPKKKKKK